MLPQSAVLITAPIAAGREDELAALLATMNRLPGFADPENPLVPFARFDRLHYARFLILKDPQPEEIRIYGLVPAPIPPTLAFFADCDGAAPEFLATFAARCEPGLRQIFSFCVGFPANGDLLRWMQDHQWPIAANYVNWRGRTVRQIREEAALFDALSGFLDANVRTVEQDDVRGVQQRMVQFADEQRAAGAISLTSPEPTPLGWSVGNIIHAITVPLALIAASPLLLLYLPVFLWLLRRHETRDPEIVTRPDPARRDAIAALEDHDVTNPYIVMGYLKPGLFRLSLVKFLLWLVEYAARHIYHRGRLARVRTIHFARWAFLNDNKQVLFASNYDGSLDSYMDDFINKAGWGLNVLFSNGVGFPRTNWLILDGASNEQLFKYDLFRHQMAVQVWYKAYPSLTAFDLYRNAKVHAGLYAEKMTVAEIREWLDLF
jgi:hypothetical protein